MADSYPRDFGPYVLERLLSDEGGQGKVYLATQKTLGVQVVIKILHAHLAEHAEFVERFKGEAVQLLKLDHPSIVHFRKFDSLDGRYFIEMEYIRGESLRDCLRRHRVMDALAWSEILGGVAAGVEAAHGEGVLHRDLKPENILLPESGTGPKVLDFGIAKAAASSEDTLTAGGTVVGTPAYMAPEQLRGERLDARTDVYSLGVMTYEALTGNLPFGGGAFVDVAMRQASARARISARRSSIWFFTGRISTSGSTRPVGRITCSTTTPPDFLNS